MLLLLLLGMLLLLLHVRGSLINFFDPESSLVFTNHVAIGNVVEFILAVVIALVVAFEEVRVRSKLCCCRGAVVGEFEVDTPLSQLCVVVGIDGVVGKIEKRFITNGKLHVSIKKLKRLNFWNSQTNQFLKNIHLIQLYHVSPISIFIDSKTFVTATKKTVKRNKIKYTLFFGLK